MITKAFNSKIFGFSLSFFFFFFFYQFLLITFKYLIVNCKVSLYVEIINFVYFLEEKLIFFFVLPLCQECRRTCASGLGQC